MSNIFKLCPTLFSRGGEILSRGGFALAGYGPGEYDAGKVLLQELNQLIGIKMLTSDSLKIFVSKSQAPGAGKMPFLPSLRTPRKVAHGISLKNQMSLKNFQVIWQP